MISLQWSKLRSTLEQFICRRLNHRIKLNATVYRKSHDGPGRVWITFDKQEIFSASTDTYKVEHAKLYEKVIAERKLKPIPYSGDWRQMFHSKERVALINASNEIDNMLIDQGIFEAGHVYQSLMAYSSLAIEDANKSPDVFTHAFSLFDKRYGKRSLQTIDLPSNAHPLVVKFYKIRCEAEGINLSHIK